LQVALRRLRVTTVLYEKSFVFTAVLWVLRATVKSAPVGMILNNGQNPRPLTIHARLFSSDESQAIARRSVKSTSEADLGFSFSKFKDRIWFAVDRGTKYLAVAPKPVQAGGYAVMKGILWLAYVLPGGPLQSTASALSRAANQGPPRRLYRGFVDRFILALKRMEALRLGRTDEIDRLLQIPEQDRLEGLLKDQSSVMLVMPHCHASVVMVRGLAARYPTLMLVRGPGNAARARSQKPYYAHIGCELLDVRNNSELVVARAVLKAMRQGKIVVGIVDRISNAPPQDAPVDKVSDTVRAIGFGQPVGFAGWPARFASKCQVPILPAMVEQTSEAITLHLGEAIAPNGLVETTQAYASLLETFCRTFPMDWGFVYDKHWSRVLRTPPQTPQAQSPQR
jgi:lauroyl/myristoyl acyltransferase